MGKREQLTSKLGFVSFLYKKSAEKSLANAGIFQSQHHLLRFLSEHENICQRDIADALGVSGAAITNCLKRLEAKGYVCRTTNDVDNRANLVTISEEGRRVHEQSIGIMNELDESVLRGFSEAEIATFLDYVSRVCDNIDSIGAGLPSGISHR